MKKKFSLILLFSIILFIVNSQEGVLAAEVEKVFLKTSIKKLPNAIELSWDSINNADRYVILKDNNILYSGDKKKFKHDGLEEGEYLEYELYALDSSNKILDFSLVSTSSVHPKYKSTLGIDIITNSNSVFIDWNDIQNSGSIEYALNESDFIPLEKSELTLSDLAESTEYEVTIFTEDMSIKKENELKGDHYVKIPFKTLSNLTDKDFNELNGSYVQLISPMSVGNVASFKHNTFIAPSILKFEPLGVALQCGKGDGRGFSKTSANYRTQMNVSIYWDSMEWGFTPYANNSTKYDRYCDTSKAITLPASTTGMSAFKIHMTASEAKIYVKHEAKTPFYGGLLPAINYTYELTIAKNGTTYVYGSHDQFPWHEIYRADNGGAWKEIYTFTPPNGGDDVIKLAAVFPNITLRVSK